MQKIIPQLAVVDGDSVERFERRNVVGGSPLGCELFRAYRGGVQKGLHHAAHCEFELLGGGCTTELAAYLIEESSDCYLIP